MIWSNLIDLLFPPDPGALRLVAAFRATLAAVIAFSAVVVLGLVRGMPLSDRIVGFAVALFVTANVRDPTPRARLITIAIAPFVTFASSVLATLLLPWPVAAAAIVPPLMFAIVYCASHGAALRFARVRRADHLFHQPGCPPAARDTAHAGCRAC